MHSLISMVLVILASLTGPAPAAVTRVVALRLPAAGGLPAALVAPPCLRAQADEPATRPPADDADAATQAPVGQFLRTAKAAIPWIAGLIVVGALAVVVATCWLRKGVLTQHLSSGGGSTGAGKPQVNPKGAAEYLARLKQRQAARRTAEGAAGAAAGGPEQRPPARPR